MLLQHFWYFVTSVTCMDRIRISSWHSRTTEKITPQTKSVFLPPHLFSQSTSLIMETDKQKWVFVRFYFLIRLFLVPGVSIATTDLFLHLPLNPTIASVPPSSSGDCCSGVVRQRGEETRKPFLKISENDVLHLWHLWQSKNFCSEIMLLQFFWYYAVTSVTFVTQYRRQSSWQSRTPRETKITKIFNFVFLAPHYNNLILFYFGDKKLHWTFCDFFLIRFSSGSGCLHCRETTYFLLLQYFYLWILQ